jgi:hypothetical protein
MAVKLKRPDPTLLISGAAVGAAAAAVFLGVGIAQVDQPRVNIWSNIWVMVAIAISVIAVIVTLSCIAIGFRAAERDGGNAKQKDNSTSNSRIVESASGNEARGSLEEGSKLSSQVDMTEEHLLLLDKPRMKRERIVVSLAILPALAVVAAVGLAANSCGPNLDIGIISEFNSNPATAAMPQHCTESGPVVFVVSGREDSPSPALAGSMVTAAANAIRGSSPIGLVNLDGRPQLVAAGIFNAYVDVDQIRDLNLLAEAISRVRAKTAHADVLDALEVAANAVRSACGHGGTIYVLDSGLQDIGPVNFREPGMLNANPLKIAAMLNNEHELPHLQGISVVLIGIGYTSPPQGQLSIAQQTNLIAIWSAIAKAGGAVSVIVDPTPRDAPAPTQVPPVQLVPTS